MSKNLNIQTKEELFMKFNCYSHLKQILTTWEFSFECDTPRFSYLEKLELDKKSQEN